MFLLDCSNEQGGNVEGLTRLPVQVSNCPSESSIGVKDHHEDIYTVRIVVLISILGSIQ